MTATTPTGRRIHLDQRAVGELARTFRGQLVGPDDAGYGEHRRVWNGSIDRHPALIARCAGVADVLDALGLLAGPASPWRSGAAATASLACRSATTGW
jgi:hypothetical protein